MCIVSWDGHDKFWWRQQADLHQNLAQYQKQKRKRSIAADNSMIAINLLHP
jgi:hypothetical protein